MRIRGSTTSPVSIPSSSSLSSSSCSSSSSSCFSSPTHSTISTHSFTSSSNSTSSLPSCQIKCQGLDLLVKAVYHVAGSVVGVPYIQRRVIRRRKRPLKFTNLVINSTTQKDLDEDEDEEQGEVFDSSDLVELKEMSKKKKQRKKRSNALPSKYQDSVLQSWKPRGRMKKRSNKI